MKVRKLGTTGLEVSEIGFGTWGIGGDSKSSISYGPTDDQESKKALLRAFDLGINFYDTADLYGCGHSEILLGQVYKGFRKKVILASKVGPYPLLPSASEKFRPQHIRKSLEASLRRLQTDYLDLYQLHDPPVGLLQREKGFLEALQSLKKEGKIRAFGISAHSPDVGLIAIKEFGIPCLQVNFNMSDQRALENGLIDLCREKEVGLIARTPLCFGFLTGRYSPQARFGPTDHRSRWSRGQIELWAQGAQVFSSVVKAPSQTQAQFALRFCLSYQGISTVIPGMLSQQEVEENCLASELGFLRRKERLEVEKIYQSSTFFIRKEKWQVTSVEEKEWSNVNQMLQKSEADKPRRLTKRVKPQVIR